jgi:Mrp family chromosome partitioning ATPase
MGNVPLIEREYLALKRQAEVTNMLYLYLLNQQAQNAMKLSSDAPKTQIVDPAYAATKASSPKPLLILAGAFLMALILPVLYLRARRATKRRVDNAFELSQLLPDTPIYQLHDAMPADAHQPVDDTYVNDLRNIRSEVDWTRTKVLAVAGLERATGKSKLAYHLAESIARTQRRVLFIDTDFRHSKLGATPLGHTDRSRTLLTLLEQHQLPADADRLFAPDAALPYLRLLPATDGLQNPTGDTELLQSPQWSDLLAWARDHFDAVVLDTTSLDQYPDALPLLTAADRDFFVFTAGSSTKRSVDLLHTLVAADQTRDLHLVLNVAKPLS